MQDVFFMCLTAVPSANPTRVNVSEVTSTTITVHWGTVDCIHHNGNIMGYAVRYGVQGSHNTLTLNVSGDNVTETSLSSLMSSTEYVIEVAVFNSAGIGVFSPQILARTGLSELYTYLLLYRP